MENKLVSIITPVYNSEKYIEECIKSVINQSYKNIEMIIIDDGSTDNSKNIIEKYTESFPFIKYIKCNKNNGVWAARNIGIEKAKGRFISFLDADDLYKKNKIENQINFMLNNNYSFTYTAYDLINENSTSLNKVINAKEYEDYNRLLKGNDIGCLTVMIDRLKIETPIRFENNHHEDFVLWLKILKNNVVAYGLDEILSSYRKSNSSVSHNKIKAAIWTWNIYTNVEKLPLNKALYYFFKYTINGFRKNSYKK
ncbi:glycosyltransferase family 2 protein [Terrisporobacter glycolicus]|uniref:Teichuronic acid biosynthesis glycosyltransferase TuaG n=1 Tax=Terrisporobacter glycolicus ATCC 14880 = DSM 1288 TaxID=1121315 RepID=A0ABZ2ET81_9FIRM|nr:glycosyltransferase family 2 protein [Terrisporobacter glycolicus]